MERNCCFEKKKKVLFFNYEVKIVTLYIKCNALIFFSELMENISWTEEKQPDLGTKN